MGKKCVVLLVVAFSALIAIGIAANWKSVINNILKGECS